jgi:hypothetical protein
VGQFFTRNETWAEQAKPWIDYLSRSSFLLQQGQAVSDVAVFYGEAGPPMSQLSRGAARGAGRLPVRLRQRRRDPQPADA